MGRNDSAKNPASAVAQKTSGNGQTAIPAHQQQAKTAAAANETVSKASTAGGNGAQNMAAIGQAPAQPDRKSGKIKRVRDSYTMPEAEYEAIGEMKKACADAGMKVKRSELLRAGVALLRKMNPVELGAVVAALPPAKSGRAKKEK
jgi:hypothetical protein